MNLLVLVLVSIGLFAVGLCFLILMPIVGQTVPSLFGLFMTEQKLSMFSGEKSGTILIDPNDLDEFKS